MMPAYQVEPARSLQPCPNSRWPKTSPLRSLLAPESRPARSEQLKFLASLFEDSSPEGEQLREWLAGIVARAAAKTEAGQ